MFTVSFRAPSSPLIRTTSAFLVVLIAFGLTQEVAVASDDKEVTIREIHRAVTSDSAEPQAIPLSLEIPSEGGQPLSLEQGIDAAPEVNLSLPATGSPRALGSTVLYAARGTTEAEIAVQAVPGGVRALVNIDSAAAPERYEFRLSGDIGRLVLNADGSVAAYDKKSVLIGGFAKPWARDARGRAVPTRYETRGTTLIQVVEHRGGTYSYGITADPLWLGLAIRACIAVRCYRWWPKRVAREFQFGHITPAVKALLREWFCKKTFAC